MGLLKKIDEVLATARYYQQLSERYAEEAKRDAARAKIVAQPASAPDEPALAA